MKNRSLFFSFLTLVLVISFPQWIQADGMPEEAAPRRVRHHAVKEEAPPPAPPAPTCVSRSEDPKVRIVSWDPKQKVSKFLGEITECVTTQWDILKLLPGPNIINVEYPSEKEQWAYYWLWSYKLKNPIEDTIILMDHPGQRIHKGKDPVELYLVFNKNDVVEKVSMQLIEKHSAGNPTF
jgi:hypothetical protein